MRFLKHELCKAILVLVLAGNKDLIEEPLAENNLKSSDHKSIAFSLSSKVGL